ncbi:hypothetical protein MKX07_003706 [Trichoderma sp. CBMAI-0711]|nr:hypothetical protein MKX07_003706 [Trichoderma sp. CBMAI-0711]
MEMERGRSTKGPDAVPGTGQANDQRLVAGDCARGRRGSVPAAVVRGSVRGSDSGQGEMATKSESKSAQGMVRESALVQAEGGARWADSSLNEHATNAQSVKL